MLRKLAVVRETDCLSAMRSTAREVSICTADHDYARSEPVGGGAGGGGGGGGEAKFNFKLKLVPEGSAQQLIARADPLAQLVRIRSGAWQLALMYYDNF